MGYDIRVGNAVPKFDKQYGELYAAWKVQAARDVHAPTFVNDELTSNTNSRSPSYSGWAEFTRAVGIYNLFFDDADGLMSEHPGCKMITQEHLEIVQTALIKYQATTTKKPGFYGWDDEDNGEFDGHLARLFWLEWWMRWALANCETPAIENT